MKTVVFTEEAKDFADTLDQRSKKKLAKIRFLLEEHGFSQAPMTEKVEGTRNLFAIRILTDANARFFYCYDDGTCIYILSGYLKKTEKIPKAELKHALAIKKGLGL